MIDILVIALIAGAAYSGWRKGLVVALVAAGAFVLAGTIFAIVASMIGTVPAVAFVLGGTIVLVPVAMNASQIAAASEAHLGERALLANRVGGSAVTVLAGLSLAWFVGAVASVAPAESPILNSVRHSAILGLLAEGVPPSGTIGSIVLRSGVVPSLNGPIVLADEPDDVSATLPAVLAAQSSVLQVRGRACDAVVTGTGWVAGPGLILTNAHVVAGQTETTLTGGPGYEGFPARVTAFDPVNDVAVLTADGRALPPAIPLNRNWKHGQRAAVIGFPKGGIRRVIPARIDRVATYPTQPLGGGAETDAPILAFRAEVQHGNSGGPILAEDGTALGLVVSKGLGQRIEAAYGVASADLQNILVEGARRVPVSTGRCLSAAEQITGQ